LKDRTQRTNPKWTNRQRTLVFSSRGISYRVRHLLYDVQMLSRVLLDGSLNRWLCVQLRVLMPHSKKDVKMDRKDRLGEIIPEVSLCCGCCSFSATMLMGAVVQICEMKNCNNCIYFEMRKKQDAYLWYLCLPSLLQPVAL